MYLPVSPRGKLDRRGRDSTAVYVEVSYGVHTSGHGRALHARHEHWECEVRLAAKFRAGLLHSSTSLTATVLLTRECAPGCIN